MGEQTLKRKGYKTIEDLKRHPRWNKQAADYMKIIDNKEVYSIQKWLWQRLPKSHPLLHYLAGFCQDQDFAIIDIETLGLSERPIVLLGIAKPKKDHICTNQFLLRDIQDEPSAIWSLVSQLEPNLSLITFNGRSFDIPYIKQRLAYYGLDAPLDNPHFDVLHFTRRALRNKLSDCKLETVEKYIDHLEKAFIVYRLGTLSRNLRNELKSTRKIYFYDNGTPLYDYTGCEPEGRDGCHGIRDFFESRAVEFFFAPNHMKSG